MMTAPTFPAILQSFFCTHLISHRQASPQTIASYRDSFRLLIDFAAARTHRAPSALRLADLDAPLILSFLEHLERDRHNSARTRNVRLAAVRSFLHYASHEDPTMLAVIQRALAIPTKLFDRPLLGFLTREELGAVLVAPDGSTWSGARDRVLFATMYNTGARVSEIIGVRVRDLSLGKGANLHLHGKGRKERVIPLWRETAKRLTEWLPRINAGADVPLFPNRIGAAMTRSGVEHRLRVATRSAAEKYPSLTTRRISPHTLRHTTAMHLLQSGVDITVIALWLGHESIETTHHYIEADLEMKEDALKKLQGPPGGSLRFHPSDRLLQFLDGL
jgi:integrase/recombinase XerD